MKKHSTTIVLFSAVMLTCLLSSLVHAASGIGLLSGKCLLDSNCGTTEYCDTDFPNPVGDCKQGHAEGVSCLRNSHCASKQCSFFSCKKRIQVQNGPCNISADCPDNQYCDDIKGRNDLRQCYDRRCTGTCSKNSQCLSNKCHLFICSRGDC